MRSHDGLKVFGIVLAVLLAAAAAGIPLWLASQAQAGEAPQQAEQASQQADDADEDEGEDKGPAEDVKAKADSDAAARKEGASATSSAGAPGFDDKVVINLQGPSVSQDVSSFKKMVDEGQVSSIRLIGDSITAGYGCEGWTDPNAARSGKVIYSSDLASCYEPSSGIRCWANDFRSWASAHGVSDFTNAGIVGESMATLAAEPDSWIGDGADVIFVMLGSNDEAAYDKDQFKSCAEVALANVRQHCKLMVVLAPPNNRQQGRFSAADCAQVLQDVCREKGYCFVSLYDSVDLSSDQMGADGLHPTTEGSDAMWTSLSRQLGLD